MAMMEERMEKKKENISLIVLFHRNKLDVWQKMTMNKRGHTRIGQPNKRGQIA